MKKSNVLLLIVALMAWGAASQVDARGYRPAQLPNYADAGAGCNLCHTSGGGTPRNAFGLAVEAITGNENVEFWGPELAGMDSDGDGVSNGAELGDPDGAWSPGDDNPAANVTLPGDENSFDPDALPSMTAVEESTWGQVKGLLRELNY